MNEDERVVALLDRIEVTPGCWLWSGARNSAGYAVATIRRRQVLVHRLMYEFFAGPIPPGLQIDHVWERGCRNKHCVRPAHLEPVTPGENTRRCAALRTVCKHGHPLSGDNVTWRRGYRRCLHCERAVNRAWRARRKAAV